MPCHVWRRSLIHVGLVVERERRLRDTAPARRRRRARTSAPACRSCAAPCGRAIMHPRLPAVIALQPVEREVGDDGRVVAGPDLAPLAVEVELGVEVLALALVRDEVVEARARLVVVLAHVPLADVGRGVAGLLQHLGKAVHPGRELGEVVRDPVLVRVERRSGCDARLGEQSDVVQKAFLKFTPSFAMRSMCGVLTAGCPA